MARKVTGLTDGALVSPWIVNLVVADGLWTIHGLVKHHKLHVLSINELLVLDWVHVAGVHSILCWVLRVFKVAAHAHVVVLILNQLSALVVLEVALLLICLNGDVSVHTIEVFLLLCKHASLLYLRL